MGPDKQYKNKHLLFLLVIVSVKNVRVLLVVGSSLHLCSACHVHHSASWTWSCESYQETKWGILTIIDALKAFVNMKQKEDEGLIDYLKRFKTARDVFVSHLGGPLILTKMVEMQKDYKPVKDVTSKIHIRMVALCEGV